MSRKPEKKQPPYVIVRDETGAVVFAGYGFATIDHNDQKPKAHAKKRKQVSHEQRS